ncbi:hypothetical protein N665_0619s0003 [Sinapis alba]|nr:hypothetical protein N665_0619s0003 [Sinapis alba]
MERSNNIEWRNNLYGRSRTSPWSYVDYDNYQQDHGYLLGFPWPPRSYTCSFCKREFRSAQALGGHMNVHRRERARLRLQQSSPSSSTPSPPYSYFSMATSHPLTLFPTLSPPSSPGFGPCLTRSLTPKSKHLPEKACEIMKPTLVVEAVEAKRLCKKEAHKFLKNGEIISLNLDIGLINESEQDLDLELRLGFA